MGVEIECMAILPGTGIVRSFVEPQKFGFSNAVTLSHNAEFIAIHVSGAVGRDSNGRIPTDLSDQAAIAMDNISTTLSKCSASLADIVKRNVYIVDIDEAKLRKVG